jgi:aminoglycoside 6'-N-acetyltransferase I
MKIRPVSEHDRPEWQRLRTLLWPQQPADHNVEIDQYFAEQSIYSITFVIELGDDRLGGFVEVRVRNYAEGCSSDLIAYLEGWYVEAGLREQGLGGQLVMAAEEWAREQGLTEMAGDCLIDNESGLQAHLALDFEEVERIVCLRKSL